MRDALHSPWAAFAAGVAVTAALYVLAWRLVPHVTGS